MCVDFWCETASPVKNGIKETFLEYAKQLYEKEKIILSSYFPSSMGGDMAKSDYLISMKENELPENLLTQSFNEISTQSFISKYIKSGIYKKVEIEAYFPETIVVDLKRLGSRPVPESFEDLSLSCYKNEICIIGVNGLPDPLTANYLYLKKGEDCAKAFISNIAGFGAPVNAIRHMGKSSNSFGSIFIMPLLFASVCKEKKDVQVIVPSSGVLAEAFVFASKNPESEKSKLIRKFLSSKEFCDVMTEKQFFTLMQLKSENKITVNPVCKKAYYENLETVYTLMKANKNINP